MSTTPTPLFDGRTEDLRAPYRSEAFAEDLFETAGDESALPWTWSQAGVATLLCAVPASIALLGGAVGLLSGAA